MSDVAGKVREYIEEFITYGDPVGDDESLIESGTVDSTGAMELILFLEETFGIEVDDDEIDPENLDSITIIASFVSSKLKEAA